MELMVENEDLGEDVFNHLHGFASNPVAPGDYCMCLYHHHSLDPETRKVSGLLEISAQRQG